MLTGEIHALEWQDIQNLSLEELANIEVSAADKVLTPLNESPSSVYVIDAYDIRRSGATTLLEALQLAPNLIIGRVKSYESVVSSRGFFEDFSNKLLVLIDGRIVYTPLYSGVFWDSQDLMVDNIKQIEVISGPADVSWGSNAVNGVINIITFSAQDNQSELVRINLGNSLKHAAFNIGQDLKDDISYRIYAKTVHGADSALENGQDAGDQWRRNQIGFRIDQALAQSV